MPTVPNPDDFSEVVPSVGSALCVRLKLAMNTLPSLLSNAFAWMFTNAGKLTTEFANQIKTEANPIPPGVYIPYSGATAPTGWVLCDGTAYNKDTYSDLFAVIGYTYTDSPTPGQPTFNVPDLRGKTPFGANTDNIAGKKVDNDFAELDGVIYDHYHVFAYFNAANYSVLWSLTNDIPSPAGGDGTHMPAGNYRRINTNAVDSEKDLDAFELQAGDTEQERLQVSLPANDTGFIAGKGAAKFLPPRVYGNFIIKT